MQATESRDPEPANALAPASQINPPRTTGSNKGSIVRKVALVVILLALGALVYWKVTDNRKTTDDAAAKLAAAANRAIPVTAAPVVAKTMPIFLNALGTVSAYNTVTIKSRVDGQLLSVNVREGQQVRQGQVLAMIDPRPYDAAVAQAQGQLTKDQATANNARAEADRYTALLDAGVVSKESQQTQVSNAGVSAGVLEADRAAIQAAKVNVGYTRIASPINGVVGLRQVDAGNIVHASDANGLLVVTQLQPITVIFTLPEDQLQTVMKTMRAGHKLVVDAYDRSETAKLATGTLLTLDNEIDTTTGTVKAKAVFDNKDAALFPNQFVNIRLVLEERADSLVMPVPALQNGSAGTFVYLVKPGSPPKQANDDDGTGPVAGGPVGKGAGKAGGKAPAAGPGAPGDAPRAAPYYVDVQPVVVDLTEGSQIILKSGLKAGDQVVVDGQEKLKKYSRVDLKAPQSPGQPGGRAGGRAGGRGAAGAGAPSPDPSPATPQGRAADAAPPSHAGPHGPRKAPQP